MTALGIGPDARRRLSAPRIAEIVADELRRQIIDGELADGDLLPRQEVLVEQFNVSLVSLREALRILRDRGSGLGPAGQPRRRRRARADGGQRRLHARSGAAERVRRCRRPGHALAGTRARPARRWPPSGRTARTPCVPELKQVNASMAENLDDGRLFTEIGRQFHDLVVRGCGNHTMIAVVGSLESLWTSHEQQWADESAARGTYPSLASAARCSTRIPSSPT